MKRLLLVAHSSELKGAERQLLRIAEYIQRLDGWCPVVLLPGPGPSFERLQAIGIEVHVCRHPWWMGARHRFPFGLWPLLSGLVAMPRLLMVVRNMKAEACIANTCVAPFPLFAASLLGMPTAVMIRETVNTNPTLQSAVPKRWLLWALSLAANRVWPVSNFVAGQLPPRLRDRCGPALGSVVHGVCAEALPRPVAEDAPFVVLGTISAEKGQLDAVDAVALLASAGMQVRLRIVGTGSRREVQALLRRVRHHALGSLIELRPWTNDVQSELSEARALLVPSRNEALGLVVFDALTAGVPVIGYRAGALPELLRFGGGSICLPGPDGLAQAMLAELRRPLESRAEECCHALTSLCGAYDGLLAIDAWLAGMR